MQIHGASCWFNDNHAVCTHAADMSLASETTKEREARLQQMSVHQHDRLASKTTKEREARLQQTSVYQHDRLVSETSMEREARLQQVSIHAPV